MSFFNKINRFYRVASQQTRAIRRFTVGKGDVLSSSAASVFKNTALLRPSVSCRRISNLKSENESVGGISIEDLKEDDIEEVKELMRMYYYSREPQCRMLNLTYEDHKDVLEDSIKEWIGKKVSTIARDKKTRKVVGCALATITQQGDNSSSKNYISNIKARYNLELDDILKDTVDLYKKYNVEKILSLEIANVDPSYAQQGISKHMLLGNESRGRNQKCQLATGVASNILSQNFFKKIGYTKECEIEFAAMRIDGKQVLDLSKNLGTILTRMVIKNL